MGIGGRTCIPEGMDCASSQKFVDVWTICARVEGQGCAPAWVLLVTRPFSKVKKKKIMRDATAKDMVQVSWNIVVLRAFGCPVFPEIAPVNSHKAQCAELFKELQTPNNRRVQQH